MDCKETIENLLGESQNKIEAQEPNFLTQNNINLNSCIEAGDKLFKAGKFSESIETYNKVLEHVDSQEIKLEKAQIYFKMARSLKQNGDHAKAKEFLMKALDIYTNSNDNNYLYKARVMMCLGQVHMIQANYSESYKNYECALQILDKLEPSNTKDRIECYNNIAQLYEQEGKYLDAKAYLVKTMSIVSPDQDNEIELEIARSYFLMGKVVSSLASYEVALSYLTKSLEINERYYGALNHPDIALIYNAIGKFYGVQGKMKEALEYFETALSIKLKFFGENHPSVASSYNNIGSVHNFLRNYDLAIENLNKCLKIELACYGSSHPNIGRTYNNMANLMRRYGKYNEALEFCKQGLGIQLQLGENNTL